MLPRLFGVTSPRLPRSPLCKSLTADLPCLRIDYLQLSPTYDIYFDVNSGITVRGHSYTTTFSNMSSAGPANYALLPMNGTNEIYFDNSAGPGYLYGNVTLEPAATYSVYACREVSLLGITAMMLF